MAVRYLTANELIDRLDISRARFAELCAQGLPVHLKERRHARYVWPEVKAWLAARGESKESKHASE